MSHNNTHWAIDWEGDMKDLSIIKPIEKDEHQHRPLLLLDNQTRIVHTMESISSRFSSNSSIEADSILLMSLTSKEDDKMKLSDNKKRKREDDIDAEMVKLIDNTMKSAKDEHQKKSNKKVTLFGTIAPFQKSEIRILQVSLIYTNEMSINFPIFLIRIADLNGNIKGSYAHANDIGNVIVKKKKSVYHFFRTFSSPSEKIYLNIRNRSNNVLYDTVVLTAAGVNTFISKSLAKKSIHYKNWLCNTLLPLLNDPLSDDWETLQK